MDGSVVYSTDGGGSWIHSYPDSLYGNRYIYTADFVSQSTGYLGGYYGLLMKTTDGGISWIHLTSPGLYYTGFEFIDENTGYVAGLFGYILKTTDGGNSWTYIDLSHVVPYQQLAIICFVSPSTGYLSTYPPGHYPGGSDGYLLKTTNSGTTWSFKKSFPGSYIRNIYFPDQLTGYFVLNPSIISPTNSHIIKTTDGGISWDTTYQGEAVNGIKFLDANYGAVAGRNGMIRVTSNGGTTWQGTSTGYNLTFNALDILYSPGTNSTTIVAAGDSGILASSTNWGHSWNQLCNAVTMNSLYSIRMVDGKTGYACGGDNIVSTLIKTSDGGNNWEDLNFEGGGTLYSQSWVDNNTGYVASSGPDGIFKTTDGGLSFIQLRTGGHSSSPGWNDISFINETGYACSGGGEIVKTTDGGTSWIVLSSTHGTNSINSLFLLDSHTLFTAGDSGKISRSTDGGLTFTAIDIINTTLYSVAFSDIENGIAAGSGGKVYRTTNGGISWTESTAGNSAFFDIIYITPSIVWISGEGVMYYSFNAGETWNKANKFHGQEAQYSMSISDGWLFTVGQKGNIIKNYANPSAPVGVKDIDYSQDYTFILEQNYPNPFNPETVINFQLLQEGYVTLKIYDVLGTEITSLVNEYKGAGRHSVQFDGSKLSSGVYFYSINAGEYHSTKKMMLLK